METRGLCEKVLAEIRGVPGTKAVVLGGSRARGAESPDSDLDIGVYYDPAALDWAAVNAAASRLDDGKRPGLIGPSGSWGNWVDTGGWLVVGGVHTDLILRSVTRVRAAAEESAAGVVSAHYQPGHPHAFLNCMYLGEADVCKILWEKDGFVSGLKKLARPYPEKLRAALLDYFLFEAGFSLGIARTYMPRGDAYYAEAHMVRFVSALNEVLFADNGQYLINEKGAVKLIDGFPLRPDGYGEKIGRLFSLLPSRGSDACALAEQLLADVSSLSAAPDKA